MGKASKARKRRNARKKDTGNSSMDVDSAMISKEKSKISEDMHADQGVEGNTAKITQEKEGDASSHSIFKRHAAEMKAVKHQIAILKARKKKLRGKFVKEAAEKKAINKEIKRLLADIETKHAAELKQAGRTPEETEKIDVDVSD